MVAVAICLLGGAPAFARKPYRLPFHDSDGRISATVALESPSVRRELRLSDSQEEQVAGILRKTGEVRKELVKVADAPRSSRGAAEAKLLAAYVEGDNAAHGLLTDAQTKRLRQLRSFWIVPEHSCFGHGACRDLNLSSDQERMASELFMDYVEQALQVSDEISVPKTTIVQRGTERIDFVETPPDPMAALRRKFRDRFLRILTPSQAALLGAEFEVNINEFPAIGVVNFGRRN